jgi:hypothetical protein
VKTIGDLLRLWCPEGRTFGIDAATIPRDRHDFRVLPEPFGEAVCISIRKKINNAVRVQVDKNRSILLAFSPSPIVDTQVVNREHGKVLIGFLPHAPQHSVVVGHEGQSIEESLPRTAASHITDQPYNFRSPIGLTPIDARDTGQPLAEDPAWARRIPTAKSANRRPQLDRHALPRKILEASAIATVPGSRHFIADWANGILLNVDHQTESVRISLDTVQDQNVRVRQKGFANGSGEVPSLPQLKTIQTNIVSGPCCTNIAEDPENSPFRRSTIPHPRSLRPAPEAVFPFAPFSLILGAVPGTARSGQGRAGFARRSGPLRARTVLKRW